MVNIKKSSYLNILFYKKLVRVFDWVNVLFCVYNFSGLYTFRINFNLLYIVIVLARLNSFRQVVDFHASHFLSFYGLAFILRTYDIGLFNFSCFIEKPLLRTVTLYYPEVNWYEREMWDMFGLTFINNLNHVRILTDYGFDSFPLRKDYPLVGYVEYFFDLEINSLVFRDVFLVQEFRYFFKYDFWYKSIKFNHKKKQLLSQNFFKKDKMIKLVHLRRKMVLQKVAKGKKIKILSLLRLKLKNVRVAKKIFIGYDGLVVFHSGHTTIMYGQPNACYWAVTSNLADKVKKK